MDFVRLPRTDLSVFPICMGTGEVGSSFEDDAAFALLDRYVETGGNFVDTAHNYGDWVKEIPRSASEKTIGRWLKSRGAREHIVLATKGGHPPLHPEDDFRLSRAVIVRELDDSLQNLQTDQIDLYWIHKDDRACPIGEIIETLAEQQAAGKIRCFGASNFKTDRLREAKQYAAANNLPGFVADQCLWNAAVLAKPPYGDARLGWMDDTGERFDFHTETEMAVIPYQSQAYGLFQRMENNTLEQMNPGFRSFYKIPESQKIFARMQPIMKETGLSVTQVVLGYLRGQPFVTVPIVGCRSLSHLDDTLRAAEISLTPQQIHFIENGDSVT